jgi:N-acetylglucosamine kinase-like BadF-type ATPase
MTRYFLGADLGSSKTHVLVADDQGHALGFGRSGPGNHETVGYDGLRQALKSATEDALWQAGLLPRQIDGAGFGVSGYDWPAEREPTLQALQVLGLDAPTEAVNDAVIGLIAGASQGWGIAIVGGTGCNCWGWDKNRRIAHLTGCGYRMGEAGGGGDLVEDAVRAISREWSLRGPATGLTPALIHHTGASNLPDLIEGLSLGRYHITAADAPLVFQIAAQGDPVAVEIVRKNGRDLGELAQGIIRQLNFEALEFEAVLVGSIYTGSQLLVQELESTVHAIAPRASFVRLKAPPVVGSVLLGMEIAGLPAQSIRQTLIRSTIDLTACENENQSE